MKKYSYLLLLALASIVVSCSDATDIDQPGRLSEEAAFESIEDFEQALTSTYGIMDATTEIQFNALFTDELSIGFDNGGQGLGDGTYGFVLTNVSAAPTALWTRSYSLLNNVNILIDAMSNYEIQDGEQSTYNNVLGQCLAIRAFAHHTVMTYWSTDLTDDSALAGILLDYVPTPTDKPLRNTNGEFYALIESDLSRAETLINLNQGEKFIGIDFVRALRARVAAYRGDYSTAASLAAGLVQSYPLANRAEYEAMFLDTGESEVIFELDRTIGDNFDGQGATGSAFAGGWAGANFAFVDATLDGSPYFEMGRTLFNQLDPADVRFDVNVAPSSIIDPNYQTSDNPRASDILVIQKYVGSDSQPLMNDLKIFRSAEMVMIQAEAAADAGNLNGPSNSTAAFIKQLRDARFGTDTALPNFANQQEAFAAILSERFIEFCFEGHRYKDLKRLGARAGVGVERDPIDCAVNGACTLPATDYRFTMPIPRSEIAGNPDIADQQNPGY